jgi:hypothetical protein
MIALERLPSVYLACVQLAAVRLVPRVFIMS